MSTEAPKQGRTPAPAGAMSRILEEPETKQFGIAPWMVQVVADEDGLEPGTMMTAFAAPGAGGIMTPPAQGFRPKPQSGAAGAVPAPPGGGSATPPGGRRPTALEEHLAGLEEQLRQLEAARQREVAEAHERGRSEAEARGQARIKQEIEPWLLRMAKSIEDIATVKQRYLRDSEEQLVRLSVAIARRILYREIQVDAEALIGLIRAAVDRSETRELNRILLNPQDRDVLAPHLERLHLPPRVEIACDATLERGALMLESGGGTLDASIQTQLDEVERGFIDMLGRR